MQDVGTRPGHALENDKSKRSARHIHAVPERIGAQKWIALYMQGAEAWAEYRRLDFGILQLPVDGVLNGSGIPARLQYPLDEQTLNAAEYAGGVSANGGADDLDTKMWWDVN